MEEYEKPLEFTDEEKEIVNRIAERLAALNAQQISADDISRRPIRLQGRPRRAKTAPKTHLNLESNCRKARRLAKKEERLIEKFDAKKEKLLGKLDSYQGGTISTSRLNSALNKLALLNCEIQRLDYRRMTVVSPPKKAKLNLTIYEKIIHKLESMNDKYTEKMNAKSKADNENSEIKKDFHKLIRQDKISEAREMVENFHPEYKPADTPAVPRLSDDEIRALIDENERLRSQLSRTQQPVEQPAPRVVEGAPADFEERISRAEERATLAEQKYAAERNRTVEAEAKIVDTEKRVIVAEQKADSEKRRADEAEAKATDAERRAASAEQRADSEKRKADSAEVRAAAAEKECERLRRTLKGINDSIQQARSEERAHQPEVFDISPDEVAPKTFESPAAFDFYGSGSDAMAPIANPDTIGNGGVKK